MKRLVKPFLMLSIASIAILSSCSKDDDNAEVTDVKIEVTSTPASPVVVGSIVTINVTATGNVDNKLKSIVVTRTEGDKTILSKSLSGTTAVESIVDTIGSEASYTYVVVVTGEKGSGTPASKTFVISTKALPGQLDVTPNAIPLFGQSFPSGGAHFMQLSDPFTPFTTDEFEANLANINLVYYYGGSKHSLTSPTDAAMQADIYKAPNYTWTGAKGTQLAEAKISSAKFEEYEQGDSDEALTAEGAAVTTWSTSAKSLLKDKVLIFKTSTGKYGYIKVDAATGTSGVDGQLDLKIIAQQ
jgi:hypothetical protein